MAKNTNDESAAKTEQTVTFNRKKLVTAGWIAGGVLALGATFAAGAAVGHVLDGPRGGDFAAEGFAGHGGERGPQGGPLGGPLGGPHMGDRDGDGDMGHGPQGELGEMQGGYRMQAPTDGSTVDGSVPAPTTTP